MFDTSKILWAMSILIGLCLKDSLGKSMQQQLNNGLPETYFGGKTLAPSSPTFQEDRSMEPVFSSRGFIPPRNGWKWWRYHEMGDHEILDHLLNAQHYDKRETPPSQSGTLLVNVSLTIRDLVKNSEHSRMRAEGLMIQKWFDPRLIHENRRTGKQPYLNAIHHFDSIWTPGCLQAVCNNGEESRKMSVKALEVFPNGTVCSVSQLEMVLSCQGDALKFPFDDLICVSQFECLSYSKEEITFQWSSIFTEEADKNKRDEKGEGTEEVVFDEEGIIVSDQQPSLDAVHLVQDGVTSPTVTHIWPTSECSSALRNQRGNVSCLQVGFQLRRDLGQYWSELFLPDMILVATSFLTFWLDWSSVPARAILGVGTMLSYFSNNRWSLQNALNRQENRIVGGGTSLAGSEMTALDLWRTVSIAFIYAACAEFVLVNFLGKRSTKKSKVSQLQELLDHQRQKMQQQLDKLRLEFNSRMNMRASTPQAKFEKTATLMRHHHRPHQDINRHSLSILLDPSRPPTSVDSISGTSVDQPMIGMNEPMTLDDDPIFVPHYEKVQVRGARNRCVFNLAQTVDRICRFLFPFSYLVFVLCFFSKYSF